MPYDPTKPANNAEINSPELRSQFTGLNAAIQQRALPADIAAAIAGTSNNTNAVGTLGQSADGSYNSSQMQMLFDKLDELIVALRR